jgi:hypothetical protein
MAGNSARSVTSTSVSFEFELFKDLRETEITLAIAESASSCRTRKDPVSPVLPMSVAIMS